MYIYLQDSESFFYSTNPPTQVDMECAKEGSMSIIDCVNKTFIFLDDEDRLTVQKIEEGTLITEPATGKSYHTQIKYQGPL